MDSGFKALIYFIPIPNLLFLIVSPRVMKAGTKLKPNVTDKTMSSLVYSQNDLLYILCIMYTQNVHWPPPMFPHLKTFYSLL